jgi:diguanylate cyclase (GGDEF)-like protein/PAS domain S-box-containing protein
MSLRLQTALALGIVLIITLAVLFTVIRPTLSGTFARLEVDEVRAHVARIVNAIDAEVATMESTADDWGSWDDTYEYIGGELPSYDEDNLTAGSLQTLRLNFMLLAQLDGEQHAAFAIDLETGLEVDLPAELLRASFIAARFPALTAGELTSRSGMLRLEDGLLLVAADAILTSQAEGPSRGLLIVGRFLDTEEMARLAEQTQLLVAVRDLDASEIDPWIVDRLLAAADSSEETVVHPTSGDSIAGHTLLRDVEGSPVAVASIETSRDTYQAGQSAVRFLGGAAVAILVASSLLLLFLLDTRVLRRLSALASGMRRIRERHVPSGRVNVSGRDEIGRLASRMNEMLESLEQSRLSLERSEKRYHSLFDYSRDAIYITLPDGRFVDANQALVDLLGCPREELLRTDAKSFYVDPAAREVFREAIAGPGFVIDYPTQLKRPDGTVLDCLMTSVVQTDESGETVSYQGIIRDITELKRQQDELAFLAMHDPLTGLLNRGALADRLALELARADRNLERCGVVYIDLDRFKEVNDTQGHAVGDLILRQAAQRLVGAVRKSDSIARIGGDEFVILIPELESPSGHVDVAEKLLRVLQEPFAVAGQQFTLSASIGIAIFPDDGSDPTVLLQYADGAMYVAKQQGRGRWHRYDGEETGT